MTDYISAGAAAARLGVTRVTVHRLVGARRAERR